MRYDSSLLTELLDDSVFILIMLPSPVDHLKSRNQAHHYLSIFDLSSLLMLSQLCLSVLQASNRFSCILEDITT